MRDASLKKLNLEGNNIGDETLIYLVDKAIRGFRMEFLNVSRCAISDFGARSLAKLVFECTSLRVLFMAYNRVMGRGGAEIARALKVNSVLEVLDISYNSVGGGRTKLG